MTAKTLLLTKLAFDNDNGFNTIFSLYITEIFFTLSLSFLIMTP